jgi:hypothetical protein
MGPLIFAQTGPPHPLGLQCLCHGVHGALKARLRRRLAPAAAQPLHGGGRSQGD